MKTLEEFAKEYKINNTKYYSELDEWHKQLYQEQLFISFVKYVKENGGILSEEDKAILNQNKRVHTYIEEGSLLLYDIRRLYGCEENYFRKIKQNSDSKYIMLGYIYGQEALKEKFNSLTRIERVESIRLCKKKCNPDRKKINASQIAYMWNQGEQILTSEEKDLYYRYLQWLKEDVVKQKEIDKHQGKIALWAVIIVFIVLACFVGAPVLYFVGGLAWTGFNIFASDGSLLGYIFGIASVILTLGMFVTLIRAILDK